MLCDLAGDKDADSYRQRSQQVAQRILELMYDEKTAAFSGAGYGARQFTWSGLIVDMMRIREEVKQKHSTQTQTTRNFL